MHCFTIEGDSALPVWPLMTNSYGPFEISQTDTECCFELTISDKQSADDEKVLVYSNQNDVEEGFIAISIFKKRDNGLCMELRYPFSKEVNANLEVSDDFAKAVLTLCGSKEGQWYTFNAAVNLCYILATIKYHTLLLHSSAVMCQGKAYLFLGKSGTGKSTHSRMWQSAIAGVTLINDDHPVVRVWESGDVVAYGSPWSGKTPCYKSVSAPLGGIVRIVRAPHNKAIRLSPIQAYASIMTSCGGMTWVKEYADGRDATIQKIISRVPCWNMECRPDEDAALVCAKAVLDVQGN